MPATLRDKYYEVHDLVIQAWTRPEPFAFNGNIRSCATSISGRTRSRSQTHLIWIPGGGSIETWEWVTQQRHRYAYLSYYGFLRQESAPFLGNARRMGWITTPIAPDFYSLSVSLTPMHRLKPTTPAADYFYNKCLHVYPGYAEGPGYRTIKTIRAGIRPQIDEEAKRIRENLKWKDFIEQGYVIAGSPATVRQRLQEAIKMLNIGHLMVLCQFGNLDKEDT